VNVYVYNLRISSIFAAYNTKQDHAAVLTPYEDLFTHDTAVHVYSTDTIEVTEYVTLKNRFKLYFLSRRCIQFLFLMQL